ncbi:MAG: bifunctional DNA-formamidopyrimidine glycosylase/DNA-(apurinic or apyrimidinic site) lyase [Thermoanaerobaculia bacterium]|nr:bifunctional DNA-formamidopyrimidine glycosylase/DNA-(apurinic or apyrimidinic site) lyase [Thermoanaerobaculia bacterium]
MPELPEVEVLRRTLEPHLCGDRVDAVEVREPRLRERVSAALPRRVSGRAIGRLDRRSKYLLVHLEGDLTMAVHLGMSGRLTLRPPEAPSEPHEHLVFRLSSGRELRFRDPRRFGLVFVVPTSKLAADRHFRHLGVEPLGSDFDGSWLRGCARGRRAPVKSFLMNATVVVGVGNIYACEALFRAGIHPRRSVARIAEARWERLGDAVVAVLEDAITQGGTTLNDFTDGLGESGYFQVSLEAYGREGRPCPRCGLLVRKIRQQGRSTFYCAGCQR